MDVLNNALISLRRILRASEIHTKQLARQSGLTTSKLLVLQTIEENGEVTVGRIAEEVKLTQATITAIIDQLQKGNLVKRERSTSDKRKVFVSLTDQGQENLVSAPTALHEKFSHEFETLEEWEQLQMAAVLNRLARMMGAERIDAAPVLEAGRIDHHPTDHSNNTNQ